MDQKMLDFKKSAFLFADTLYLRFKFCLLFVLNLIDLRNYIQNLFLYVE